MDQVVTSNHNQYVEDVSVRPGCATVSVNTVELTRGRKVGRREPTLKEAMDAAREQTRKKLAPMKRAWIEVGFEEKYGRPMTKREKDVMNKGLTRPLR